MIAGHAVGNFMQAAMLNTSTKNILQELDNTN